jgi:hypothetical protein
MVLSIRLPLAVQCRGLWVAKHLVEGHGYKVSLHLQQQITQEASELGPMIWLTCHQTAASSAPRPDG